MADDEQPSGPEPPGGWLPPEPPGGPAHPPPPPPPAAEAPSTATAAQPPLPNDPGNAQAVAGFTCAVVGASLLVVSMGISSILSLTLGIIALPTTRNGKKAVEEGRTRKSEGLANAGWIVGIITVALSVLATIIWVLLIVVLDSIDWEELEDDWDDNNDEPAVLRAAVAAIGAAARLLA